jgi:hypothetical protein
MKDARKSLPKPRTTQVFDLSMPTPFLLPYNAPSLLKHSKRLKPHGTVNAGFDYKQRGRGDQGHRRLSSRSLVMPLHFELQGPATVHRGHVPRYRVGARRALFSIAPDVMSKDRSSAAIYSYANIGMSDRAHWNALKGFAGR